MAPRMIVMRVVLLSLSALTPGMTAYSWQLGEKNASTQPHRILHSLHAAAASSSGPGPDPTMSGPVKKLAVRTSRVRV